MNRKLAVILLIIANTLWGSSYVVAKVALYELPPPLLSALRFSLASIFIWSIVLWQNYRKNNAFAGRGIRQLERVDAAKMIALGLCGISMSYLLSYWGMSLTTATDAALLIICEVIFTSILAVLILGERLGRWKRLGIVIGIAGVVVLVMSNVAENETGGAGKFRAIGDILIMGGLFCQAIYSVLGTGLSRKYQSLTLLAVTHAGSLLVWLPILIWYIAGNRFPAISLMAGLSVVYLAAIISVVCFFIWFNVLRVVGAGMGAITLFVQPLVGAVMGILLLKDPVTLGLCLGGGLVFTALYLTSIPDHVSPPGRP
jgi:drug/metabolite transporter (DMT)-like permease